MGAGPITFSYANFIAQYPEFSAVSSNAAQGAFNVATIYCRNDSCSPVSSATTLTTLLYMLTGHVLALNTQSQGDPSPGSPKDANNPVGRISDASEGSVHVATEMQYPPGTPQWYMQTRYGAAFWAATSQYRRMRYQLGTLQPGGLPGENAFIGRGPGWPGYGVY